MREGRVRWRGRPTFCPVAATTARARGEHETLRGVLQVARIPLTGRAAPAKTTPRPNGAEPSATPVSGVSSLSVPVRLHRGSATLRYRAPASRPHAR
jgi:hypothetical protein